MKVVFVTASQCYKPEVWSLKDIMKSVGSSVSGNLTLKVQISLCCFDFDLSFSN